jgi:hypothetical protein
MIFCKLLLLDYQVLCSLASVLYTYILEANFLLAFFSAVWVKTWAVFLHASVRQLMCRYAWQWFCDAHDVPLAHNVCSVRMISDMSVFSCS